MKIYLIRHGQSADHEGDIRQTPDSSLGKNGRKQARAVAKRMSKEDIEAVLTSKWPRAKETAEIIAKKLNKKLHLIEGIHEKEQNQDLYGVDMDSEIQKKYMDEIKKFGQDLDWKFENKGESLRDLIKRVEKFKKYLVKNYKHKSITVVSHGLFIRTFIISALLEEYDDNTFYKFYRGLSTENTGISLMRYDSERKKWELIYSNDHQHIL